MDGIGAMGLKAGFWLVAAAAAGVAYAASGETPSSDEAMLAGLTETPGEVIAEQFRVVLSGRQTNCQIHKGDSLSVRKARLVFGAGCVAELPDLARVRYWSEETDGSVAFTAEDGKVAIRFAAGDGAAFESYGAGAPLISLIADEN
jgi:hypothetical protein